MPLIREFAALLRGTLSLWIRFLPPLLTWLTLGSLLYSLCLLGSSFLGADHRLAALLVFVLAIIARVVTTIFAIQSLKPGLMISDVHVATGHQLPSSLSRSERRVEVALLTLGPFLGIYSVWGEVDEVIRDGFVWNAVLRQWEPEAWALTFNLKQFPTYLGIAVVALAARLLWGRLVKEGRSVWLRLPILLFEGAWVFSTFFVAGLAVQEGMAWLRTRRFWRGAESDWNMFLARFSDIHLPWGVTLPEAVKSFFSWVFEVFLPVMWEGAAMPLVWLALAGMIFGWRDMSARALLPQQWQERVSASPRSGATRVVISFATEDIRDKYVPLIHALRLIWRSGPYVLGSYMVLYALVGLGQHWLLILLTQTFSVGGPRDLLLNFPLFEAVLWVLPMSLMIALYAATFDRAVRDTALNPSAPNALPTPQPAPRRSSPPPTSQPWGSA